MPKRSNPCLATVSTVLGEGDLVATINIEERAPSWFPFRPATRWIVEVGYFDEQGDFQSFMGICGDHIRPLINLLNEAAMKLEYDQDD